MIYLKKPTVPITCQVCGKIFLVFPYRKLDAKYCSRKCHGLWKSKNTVGAKNHRWRNGVVLKECKICGKIFKVHTCHLKKGPRYCCSRTCQAIAQRGKLCGDKNNKWKGGITPDMEKIRKSWRYADWREQIFKRDNFTCNMCGAVGGILNAHHIKKFSIIIKDIKSKYPLLDITEIIETTPEMWDINNGVTLCKKCHKEEHKNVNH